jgi:hypothetical protein
MQGSHGPLPFLLHQSLWRLIQNKGLLLIKVHIWDEIDKIVNRVSIANLAFECKKYRYDMLLLNYHMHHKKVTCHLKIFYLMTLLSSM